MKGLLDMGTAMLKFVDRISKKEEKKMKYIGVDSIIPNPNQPRKHFDQSSLDELCESIQRFGVLQPLLVKRHDREKYEIVAGERRYRASLQAGLKSVPCIISEQEDNNSSIYAMVENVQRQDLNVFEEAEGLDSLIREYNIKQGEVAKQLGKSQSSIANKLRLLKLTKPVRDIIIKNNLTERHARALLHISSEEDQLKALDKIISRQLSVLQTERLVKDMEEKSKIPMQRKHMVFKDIRIFLNTINHAIDVMNESGVNAEVRKIENEGFVEYVIRIETERANSADKNVVNV